MIEKDRHGYLFYPTLLASVFNAGLKVADFGLRVEHRGFKHGSELEGGLWDLGLYCA